jgi:ribosomal protein RSM22 (predicted rRNA methylase)
MIRGLKIHPSRVLKCTPLSTSPAVSVARRSFINDSSSIHDFKPLKDISFNYNDRSDGFGFVVKETKDKEAHVTQKEPVEEEPESISPFRKADGSLIKGQNAEEARLHDRTLQGRMDHSITKLPDAIAKAINNNILSLYSPGRLRSKVSQIYQSLGKEQLQTAPSNGLEANAHIAALFLQDYAHCHQVLQELHQRTAKFSPNSVLSVGYGPATGMVALNEIMGPEWDPEHKDAYIIGRYNTEMKKRAKIILSRQLHEQVEEEEVQRRERAREEQKEVGKQVEVKVVKPQQQTEPEQYTGQETEEQDGEESETESQSEYVGPVDTSQIHIQTKLRDSLPTGKKYDLIIVDHALLTKEHHFPRDVDINIHMLLRLLSPEGHIVLVERGNSVGFETVARARQIMIRPESYLKEAGKIPRPYIKGSSIKPQKLRHVDQIITEDHIKHEEKMLAEIESEIEAEEAASESIEAESEGEATKVEEVDDISDLEKDIIKTHGQVSEEDLKFEFENDLNFEFEDVTTAQNQLQNELGTESVDYHLQIIAPCSHHAKCPLQLGDPKFYKIPSHKHRLKFCSFDKVVERPKYTMELKKGKKLASPWDKTAEDGFGFDTKKKGELRRLSGGGRPGGNNTENGSYSYLIAKRAANDVESIKKIEHEREFHHSAQKHPDDPMHWPRILDVPSRVKNNVKLTTCAPSGNIEVWQVPKSLGKQEYHDARKVNRGDLWGLDKKSVLVKNQLSDKVKQKLDVLSKTQKKTFLKEQRKKVWKKLVSQSQEDFDHDIVKLSDSIATNLEMSKKYKTQGKKAKFDVDPREYDGK